MTPGRCELLRALGAIADNPADARAAGRALGIPELDSHQHTELFVLNCPPYASVYLGPDGALGGEGADRVAGFWRVMGISPPAEPDHLSSLLSLYASLGQAAAGSTRAATAAALTRAQTALFWEHLWPWLPAYLDAALDLAAPAVTAWAAPYPDSHRRRDQRAPGPAAAAARAPRRARRADSRRQPRRPGQRAPDPGSQRDHPDPPSPR